jgi:hypothetical protein
MVAPPQVQMVTYLGPVGDHAGGFTIWRASPPPRGAGSSAADPLTPRSALLTKSARRRGSVLPDPVHFDGASEFVC